MGFRFLLLVTFCLGMSWAAPAQAARVLAVSQAIVPASAPWADCAVQDGGQDTSASPVPTAQADEDDQDPDDAHLRAHPGLVTHQMCLGVANARDVLCARLGCRGCFRPPA